MGSNFIYLASASPRRSELLRQIGVPFSVIPASVPEAMAAHEAPAAYVVRIAEAKAAAVWERVATGAAPQPVLAADTAVVIDATVLGKPRDRAGALAMLEQLSGRAHEVMTAVSLRHADRVESRLCTSKVRFRATTLAEREAYCATEEPFDKAGGYGIQGLGAVFIEDLRGSYSAVMGLPLCETTALLKQFGIPAWLYARSGAG